MRRLAISCLVALSACTQSLEQDAFAVCHPLCRCSFVFPAEQRTCTDGCMREFMQSPVSEVCVACAVEHADRCSSLIDDCVPVCSQAVPVDLTRPLTRAMRPETRIAR